VHSNQEIGKTTELKASYFLQKNGLRLVTTNYQCRRGEIDLIMHNGGAKILEDKANPLVLGLNAAKEQRGAEDAASRTSDSSGLSDIERKYTTNGNDWPQLRDKNLAKAKFYWEQIS
jgi:hypothetical protein